MEVLTIGVGEGEQTLPVFGHDEEADMFVSLGGTGDGWRVRKSTAGKLSGVAWIVHGLMVPYVGLFDSIPRLVAIVLMALWAFIIGVLMWRIALPESAPPAPTTTLASSR